MEINTTGEKQPEHLPLDVRQNTTHENILPLPEKRIEPQSDQASKFIYYLMENTEEENVKY